MKAIRSVRRCLAVVGVLILSPAMGIAQAPKAPPKLEPIAETRLLMEGMAHANFKGLERLLEQKPTEDEAWKFGRGQALLIAETANLLMLRPPKNTGELPWMERATELRVSAVGLARLLAGRDYEKSRVGLAVLAVSCNRCHQSFRVGVEIQPFAPPMPVRKAQHPGALEKNRGTAKASVGSAE